MAGCTGRLRGVLRGWICLILGQSGALSMRPGLRNLVTENITPSLPRVNSEAWMETQGQQGLWRFLDALRNS